MTKTETEELHNGRLVVFKSNIDKKVHLGVITDEDFGPEYCEYRVACIMMDDEGQLYTNEETVDYDRVEPYKSNKKAHAVFTHLVKFYVQAQNKLEPDKDDRQTYDELLTDFHLLKAKYNTTEAALTVLRAKHEQLTQKLEKAREYLNAIVNGTHFTEDLSGHLIELAQQAQKELLYLTEQ